LGAKILWAAGILDESSLMRRKAASPAANRWQNGLICGLIDLGHQIECIAHMPEPLWPKGEAFPRGIHEFSKEIPFTIVPYINMPIVREFSLSFGYKRALKSWCRDNGAPYALVTYNLAPHSIEVGRYAQLKYGIKWIEICADHYDPGVNWRNFSKRASLADGHIFLSSTAFVSAPFPKKIHLDGGVNPLDFKNTSMHIDPRAARKKILLYAGMMSEWGGVSFLLRAFAKIKEPSIELWICGQGENKDLQNATRLDKRIKAFGFLPEEDLVNLYQKADIFINPRPSSVAGNTMNFPSKILVYLSYGKPVVSTWTSGLSEDYRNVLEVIDEETDEGLARSIEKVLMWPTPVLEQNTKKIFEFLNSKKLWSIQASNMVKWLNIDPI
jgi:glycosyltransferase involved in cell wall biosynthesis